MLAVLTFTVGACIAPAANEGPEATSSAEITTPSPAASVAPTHTAVPNLTPTPSPVGAFESAILGYRVTLPPTLRRSVTRLGDGQTGFGYDYYTSIPEAVEKERCARDSGDVGWRQLEDGPDVMVRAWRNADGLTPQQWATTPRRPGGYVMSTHQRVEPTTLGGLEAARLVEDNADGATTAFVVRSGGRMYEITVPMGFSSLVPKRWLDDIAKSFVAIAPAALPSPSPTVAPRIGAQGVADALAKALSARDADGVVRLMGTCWLSVGTFVDGQGTGGVLYRSIELFGKALKERFAAGDLTVVVDPTLQTDGRGEPDSYSVRSEWRYPEGTTRVDLGFSPAPDGVWRWGTAMHQYTRAQMSAGGCIPYRSPWTDKTC